MASLILTHLALAAIVNLGPTTTEANRVAGTFSLLISLVISAAIASLSRRRELMLGLLAVATIVITFLAFRYADPLSIRSAVAQSGEGLMARLPPDRILPPHLLGLAAGPPTLFLAALASQDGYPARLRALWLGGTIGGTVAIVLSDSRDAWIATCAGAAILVASALVRRRGLLLMTVLGVGLGAGLFVVGAFGDDLSLRQREELWIVGLRHVAASPLMGIGYGGLSAIYKREVPAYGTNAHNLLVQTLGDFGAIGVLVLVLLVVHSLRQAASPAVCSQPIFRGFAASLTFVGVAGMAESIIDATQAFSGGDLTIVVPLLFAVLAVPATRVRDRAVAA